MYGFKSRFQHEYKIVLPKFIQKSNVRQSGAYSPIERAGLLVYFTYVSNLLPEDLSSYNDETLEIHYVNDLIKRDRGKGIVR